MTLARSSTCISESQWESSAKPDETGNAYRGFQPPAPAADRAVRSNPPSSNEFHVPHEEIRLWLTQTATPLSPTVP